MVSAACRCLLLLLVPTLSVAAPPPPSPCEVVGDVVAMMDMHAADDLPAIAPAMVAELQAKYSAECVRPAQGSAITRCRMGFDDQAIDFLVYDQSRWNSSALSLVYVKPVSQRVSLPQCFKTEAFQGWSKSEFRPGCGPSIWRLTGAGQQMLFVEPNPGLGCNSVTDNVSIFMARGTRPAIPIVH